MFRTTSKLIKYIPTEPTTKVEFAYLHNPLKIAFQSILSFLILLSYNFPNVS